ncbi:hypothetical protein [Mesorhizobium sp. M4B.F.Ca.ET.017.02.2.1]|uniref:hypothetical protein n=1 Tax=Mesorhizobium sp. M4B.F.Ca.ET.017.02.2.1 TaxID=2496649 RepID=UPI000FCCE041|nr:hypothetical protein [Mesorhizobium sp. M4B.F.Ca.ET.017.02.2.1]RVD30183.1 hypothetical protein EN738_07285 [Mesorhizobium sp. M4B.F.Ca.ET.017.02.2.1]
MRAVLIALLLATSTAYAQDNAGVTEKGPTPQKAENRQADQSNSGTSQFSVPVRIVEDPQEAQRARDREDQSDKHDAEDLKAQNRAADAADRSATATEWQEYLAWWQLVLSGVGVVALVITIIYTVRATNAAVRSAESAEKAIADTREMSQRQLRAYAFVDQKRSVITLPKVGIMLGWTVRIGVIGQTPAYNMRGGVHFEVAARPLPAGFDFSNRPPVTETTMTMLPPGEDRYTFMCGGVICTQEDFDKLADGSRQLLMWGWVEYFDAFGVKRELDYAFATYGELLSRGMFFPIPDFQRAT